LAENVELAISQQFYLDNY